MTRFEVGERSSITPHDARLPTPHSQHRRRIACPYATQQSLVRTTHRREKTISESLTCKNPQHPEIEAYTSRSIEGDLCLGRDSLKLNSSAVHDLIVFLFLNESAEVSCEENFQGMCCWGDEGSCNK